MVADKVSSEYINSGRAEPYSGNINFVILISYNDEGLMSKEELTELLKKYGSLEIIEMNYKKFKAQEGVKRQTLVEYLFILEKIK